ncbi:hypothetical protein V2G26_016767 [Clonostachys chloroleuca]
MYLHVGGMRTPRGGPSCQQNEWQCKATTYLVLVGIRDGTTSPKANVGSCGQGCAFAPAKDQLSGGSQRWTSFPVPLERAATRKYLSCTQPRHLPPGARTQQQVSQLANVGGVSSYPASPVATHHPSPRTRDSSARKVE